ncbi:MAG: hypothetical protein ACK40M_12595 [Flavobacteriales bacterium]
MESALNRLVNSLDKEEIRHFKLYAGKYASDADRKDLSLFDYIRKSGDRYQEERIVKLLYPGEEKNSFYRLRNRLISEVSKSLLVQHYDEGDLNVVLYYLILSRIFQQKQDYKNAWFYLRRGEKKAEAASAHDLLESVYGEIIRLSSEWLEVDPEDYIRKRAANRDVLSGIQQIDDILAVLTYRIKVSQNFSKGNLKVTRLLDATIREFSANKELAASPVFRMKVYQSVSRILLQEHNYIELERYLMETYAVFTREKLFSRQNHDVKLQMLTYLVNALFKNKKYKDSLRYAEELGKATDDFQQLLKEKYLVYYYNALINNYAVLNKERAIEIILKAQQERSIAKNKFYRIFLDLQLAMQYFDLKEFKRSSKLLVKVRHEDNFKLFDAVFQLKIVIMELMVRYELGGTDIVEREIPRTRKVFAEQLEDTANSRQSLMLDFLKKAISASGLRIDADLRKISIQLIDDEGYADSSDADLIDYKEWLKHKGF